MQINELLGFITLQSLACHICYVLEKHKMDDHTPIILIAPIKKEEELSQGNLYKESFLSLKHVTDATENFRF